ncbi:MAG TPA: trypsin-like peptidase domain-containing protein [Bryobacteraceae bacterium]
MPLPVPGRVAEMLRRSTVQVAGSGSGVQVTGGSGIALEGEHVLTNAHVAGGERLVIESWEGDRLPAALIKMDRRRDLALLRVPGLRVTPGTLGDSDGLRVGTPVVAVGNPLGFTGAVSSGIVHRIGPVRFLGALQWIHADVRLAPGNSGGPLSDFQGRIMGINTMIVRGGIALAIPSRAVQTFLSRPATQGSLGVVVRPVQVPNNSFGMMILELVAGGAAEMASLLPGDILVGAGHSRFSYVDDLQAAIDEAPNGLLPLDFYRSGTNVLRHVTARLATPVQTAA